ncbi:hypothetical protein LJB86_00585 [Deltaproteobacteria bacterium OttesenSCG-928-M10]|nr:hypothetical protein [Deltaproteobacteria bacterium OttesenSCG-928-M10]
MKIFRPSVRSIWFLFFGLALGPAILIFERDPDGHPAKWVFLALVCLGLILHRLSLSYVLTDKSLIGRSWWGRGAEEKVTLAHIREVRPVQGFVGRLAGSGHLEISSDAFDEPGLSVLGQPDHLALAEELEGLAAKARRDRDNGPV